MSKKYLVTFLPDGRICEAKSGDTVLDVALANNIDLDHACGGVCACSTCHIYIKQGLANLDEASDKEEDMLDNAPFLATNSRLACQVEVVADLTVEIPSMNRNLVSEGHH